MVRWPPTPVEDSGRATRRDEGPGFDPATVPDPTDPANLEKASGRGLLLIRAYMDEVIHNRTGNQVTLVKRREASASLGRPGTPWRQAPVSSRRDGEPSARETRHGSIRGSKSSSRTSRARKSPVSGAG